MVETAADSGMDPSLLRTDLVIIVLRLLEGSAIPASGVLTFPSGLLYVVASMVFGKVSLSLLRHTHVEPQSCLRCRNMRGSTSISGMFGRDPPGKKMNECSPAGELASNPEKIRLYCPIGKLGQNHEPARPTNGPTQVQFGER